MKSNTQIMKKFLLILVIGIFVLTPIMLESRDFDRKAGSQDRKLQSIPSNNNYNTSEIASFPVKTEIIPVCWSQGENNRMFVVSVVVVKRYNGNKVVTVGEYVKNIPVMSLDLLRNFKKVSRCY